MSYVCSAVLPVQRLVDAFLAALKTAVVMQRGIKPEPTQPVELKVPGDDFTRTVNMAAGTELGADQLFGLLGGEPATWLGASQQNGQWTWDLTNARLTPYAEVRTVDDYLVRLDALVALPQQPVLPEYLPAMALPEAFDHLGLAWRIATGQHLFHVPRAAVPAKLTQPAASERVRVPVQRSMRHAEIFRLPRRRRESQQYEGPPQRPPRGRGSRPGRTPR